MEHGNLWIGLPVIEYQGVKWAVINITKYAMANQYVIRIKRGWDEKTISIPITKYDELFSPQVASLCSFGIESWVHPPPQIESENAEIEHSKDCLESSNPGCERGCPVLLWYASQDPNDVYHSEECCSLGTDECLPNCPVALWHAGQVSESNG